MDCLIRVPLKQGEDPHMSLWFRGPGQSRPSRLGAGSLPGDSHKAPEPMWRPAKETGTRRPKASGASVHPSQLWDRTCLAGPPSQRRLGGSHPEKEGSDEYHHPVPPAVLLARRATFSAQLFSSREKFLTFRTGWGHSRQGHAYTDLGDHGV